MQSEQNTPISERYLWLDGFVSASSLSLVAPGLPQTKSADTNVLFVGYAYADLPLPKEFDAVFRRNTPEIGEACLSRVVAVTQQWGKAFPEIPHGWKTICHIQFPDGVPSLIKQLPIVDSWLYYDNPVCLGSRETWDAIKNRVLQQ